MENIFISGLRGKTSTIHIEKSKLANLKISQLKSKVHSATHVEVEHQRLIYGTKQLEDSDNGTELTLKDYSIRGGATIVLVVRLPGGKC